MRALLAVALFGAVLVSFLALATPSSTFQAPSPSNDSLVNGSVLLNFTFAGTSNWTLQWANASGAWVEICAKNDSVSPQNCTWDTAMLSDTNYTINLTTINASNVSQFVVTLITNVTADNNPPSVALDRPSGNVNGPNVTFNWTVSDTIDTNVTCGLYLNSTGDPMRLNQSFGSSDLDEINITFGNELNYVWYLSCADDIGHRQTTANQSFNVELPINPRFIPSTPADGANLSGSVIVNFTYSSIADYDLYYWNGSQWSSPICTGNNQAPPRSCFWNTVGLKENDQYILNLTVEDYNNPADVDTATVIGLTIDNTAPSVTPDLPADAEIFNESLVFFNWTVSDTVDPNVTCRLYSDAALNVTFGNETVNLTLNYTDGTHTWYLNCTDYTGEPIGRYTTSSTRSFTIDVVDPVINSAMVLPRTSLGYTNATPRINLTISENTIDTCQYANVSAGGTPTWADLSVVNDKCWGLLGPFPDGTALNFTFRVNDTAGNWDYYSGPLGGYINVTVDDKRPHIVLRDPANGSITSDGETLLINATVDDSDISAQVCNATIDRNQSALIGPVKYDPAYFSCNGTVQIANPSGYNGLVTLNVTILDRVNNTNSSSITLYIDNDAPLLLTNTTNLTNDQLATDENVSFWFSLHYFDAKDIDTITIGNASTVTVPNSTPLSQTGVYSNFQNFNVTTNATALGCPVVGLCKVHITANDSFGNIDSSHVFDVIIDKDDPRYYNATINQTGLLNFTDHVLISARWSDDSLGAAATTDAVLYQYRHGSPVPIDSIALNKDLQWSNFTYLINRSVDEGRNLTFYINYTDFRGSWNVTPEFSFTVQNSTPLLFGHAVYNIYNNVSSERPTFTFRIIDQGIGFNGSAYVTHNVSNGTATYVNTYGIGVGPGAICSVQDILREQSFELGDTLAFNLSYYNITEYSVTVVAFDYNATAPNQSSIVVQRNNYPGADARNTTALNVGDTYYVGDLGITVNNFYNASPDVNTTILTFTDRGYDERLCNYTFPSDLHEGQYNATILLADGLGLTNQSKLDWFVDGARPVFQRLFIDDQAVIYNGATQTADVNVSQSGKGLRINWTIADTHMDRVTVAIDEQTLFTDNTNRTVNRTVQNLEPGIHLVAVNAYDILSNVGYNGTSANFTLYLSVYTNATKVKEDIAASLNASASLAGSLRNFTLYGNGQELTGNTSFNKSLSFHYTFNITDVLFTIDTLPVNGLLFHWNYTDYDLDISNTTQTAQRIRENSGIATPYVAQIDNYARSAGFNETFYPFGYVSQPTNWSFTLPSAQYVVLYGDENGNDLYLLTECAATPTTMTSFAEACYLNQSTNYTVFAPGLTGIAVGGDGGAPNITIDTPADGTLINNSFFTLNFSVIEPQPNATFCRYEFMRKNISYFADTLEKDDFSLIGTRYFYTQTFTDITDSSLWYLNLTCADGLGQQQNAESNFTVSDTTPPRILNQNVSSLLYYEATISITSDELAQYKIEYGTSILNLTSSTSWTDVYRTSESITLEDLSQNTRYYYRVVARDKNGFVSRNPHTSTLPSTFRTLELTGGNTGGGGGGGGAVLLEGSVIASDFHGWGELDAGPLNYVIEKENMPVSKISIMLDNGTNNANIEIKAYFGKPASVPATDPIVYQYFQINHNNIKEHASSYQLEFTIPTHWLSNISATPADVHLYRLEQGAWEEYPITATHTRGENEVFTVDLPSFSFFAIRSEGTLPSIDNWTLPVTPGLGEQQPLEEQTEEKGAVGEAIDDVKEKVDEVLVGYGTKMPNVIWFIIPGIVVLLLIGGASLYYYKKNKQVMDEVVKRPELDETDPLYKLQVYIHAALDSGQTTAEVREKLLAVGWDEIIVDEELQKAMTMRI